MMPKDDEDFVRRIEKIMPDDWVAEDFAKAFGCDLDEAIELMSYTIPYTMIRYGMVTEDGILMGSPDAQG